MRKLIIALLLVAFIVNPVSAVSADEDFSKNGTIETQFVDSLSYTTASYSNTYSGSVSNIVSYMRHDFTNAKEITTIYTTNLYKASSSTPINRYETFNAYIDGLDGDYYGTGTIALRQVVSGSGGDIALIVTFTDVDTDVANSLTGSHKIYFDDFVSFSGTTREYGTQYASSDTVSSTKPDLWLWHPSTYDVAPPNQQTISGYRTQYKNDYVYTYTSSNGLCTIDVEKYTFPSKVSIYDATGSNYISESTATTSDLGAVFDLNNKVYIECVFNGESYTELIHDASVVPTSTTLSFTGRVMDVKEGSVLEGATLLLDDDDGSYSDTTVSDSEGFFTFSDVPTGNYLINATNTGYANYFAPDYLSASSFVMIQMVPNDLATPMVYGVVKDSNTHDPLSGVLVQLDDGTGTKPSLSAHTDSYGYYEIEAPNGSYYVKGSLDEYYSYSSATVTTVSGTAAYCGFSLVSTEFDNPNGPENPLIDYDGDGEVTQDDAKEFAINYGPLLWLFMGMIFVTAALGGRR